MRSNDKDLSHLLKRKKRGISAGSVGKAEEKETPASRAIAKALRRRMTEAEAELKQLLRQHLPEYRFSHQQTIGAYIVDFACHEAKLLLELEDGHTELNAQRTEFLASKGYTLLRFTEEDVMGQRDAVMGRITLVLQPDA